MTEEGAVADVTRNVLPTANSGQKKQGCQRGCLIGIGILLIPYLLNFGVVLVRNSANQTKWKTKGSDNYTITANETSLRFIHGQSVVTVNDGQITTVEHWTGPIAEDKFEYWRPVTVQGMFEAIWNCGLLFPWYVCAIEYDSERGYPVEFTVNCPIPDACYSATSVLEVKLAP